jgi:hypothetical protein
MMKQVGQNQKISRSVAQQSSPDAKRFHGYLFDICKANSNITD